MRFMQLFVTNSVQRKSPFRYLQHKRITRLHNALITDPKPYRKDVKQLLSNLLQMIIAIDMPEIGVDRPNHSQRIFFK